MSSSDRVVSGVPGAPKPGLGIYSPQAYKLRWPEWWPEATPVAVVERVVVRRPRSADEGLPHETVVDFVYRRGLKPL